jgi:hypothetical protein
MKNVTLWGLVLLNVLLLTAFVGRLSGNDAAAAQANRRPADYLLVPAEITEGGSSAVVYMIDTTNGVLGGMVFDDARRELNTMEPVNLDRVFQAGEGVNTAGGGNSRSTRGRGTGTGTGTGQPGQGTGQPGTR